MSIPIITSSEITREQAITDILQSVALQETALAHILNVEGEKLLRVAGATTTTPETLLKTNKSIESMVKSITKLEMILHSKIESLQNDKD